MNAEKKTHHWGMKKRKSIREVGVYRGEAFELRFPQWEYLQ